MSVTMILFLCHLSRSVDPDTGEGGVKFEVKVVAVRGCTSWGLLKIGSSSSAVWKVAPRFCFLK